MKKRNTRVLVALIASVFFYFLIVPQFAFIHRMSELGFAEHVHKIALIFLGIGGISGSLLTSRICDVSILKKVLAIGFRLCLVGALLPAVFERALAFFVASGLCGLGLGFCTVGLVGLLRPVLSGGRAAMTAGLGTGAAYFFANVPFLFLNTPVVQLFTASGVCALALVFLNFLDDKAFEHESSSLHSDGVYRKSPYARLWFLVVPFCALIGLDSLAFTVIQQAPELYALSWGAQVFLWQNAWVHGLGAVLAGWLLERGWLGAVLGCAGVMIVGGCWLFVSPEIWARWGHVAYASGVSFYSTALVVAGTLVPLKGWFALKRAASLYAFAGWVASGVGVSFALGLFELPLIGLSAMAVCVLAWLYGVYFLATREAKSYA